MTRRPSRGAYSKVERAPSSAPVSLDTLSGLRPVFVEALCYHEALLRLGYEAEEIFVSPGDDILSVVLVVGDKRFFIAVGPLILDNAFTRESFLKEWKIACDIWNKASDQNRWAVFEKSFVCGSALNFCAVLVLNGFDRHVKKAANKIN